MTTTPKALIIDDIEERHTKLALKHSMYQCFHAYNYDEAIQLLEIHDFDMISFDHDLEDFVDCEPGCCRIERTGASIARYMASNNMKVKGVFIHSHNQEGAKNIASILKSGNVCENIAFRPYGFPPGMSWGE